MKHIFTLLILSFLFHSVTAQNAQKTLIKSFNLKGSNYVELNFDGKVAIKEWNNTTLRVQMGIELQNSSVHMLKYLITKGRYNLKAVETEKGMTISTPGRQKKVVVNKKGDKLQETVLYTVYIPANVQAKVINESTSSNASLEKTGTK